MIKLKILMAWVLLVVVILFNNNCFATGEVRKKSSLFLKKIGRLAWLNNNEILVADNNTNNRTRLIKYNIINNKLTPVSNPNFEQNIVMSFTNDGKTRMVYYKDSDIVSLKRGNKLIFKICLKNELIREFGGEYHKYRKLVSPIKIFDKTAIIFIGMKDDDVIEPEDYYIGFPNIIRKIEEKGYFTITSFFPSSQIYPVGDKVYAFGYSELYEYIPEEKKLSLIYDFILHTHIWEIKKLGNEIYLTAIVSLSGDNMENLYSVDLKEKKLNLIKEDVYAFDLNENFLVTVQRNSGKKIGREIFLVSVKSRKTGQEYEKHFDVKEKLSGHLTQDIFPMISPDEKHIVIMRNFAKPIVIKMDEMRGEE